MNTICMASDCFYALITNTNVPANAPTNTAGHILGINFGAVIKLQFYVVNKWNGNTVYVRGRWFGDESQAWGDWKQLAFTS